MISSAETGSGVKIMGINPEEEKNVTDIHSRVIEGEYLQGIKRNPIVIANQFWFAINYLVFIVPAQESRVRNIATFLVINWGIFP